MAICAIIIAGGVGSRMGQKIPKQFINVGEKPVIVYTLEAFQNHPLVDAIEVVCLDGWEQVLLAYARQYKIDKLKWVVKGGASGQESIRNGVFNLEGKLSEDDICIVHDGVRPMLDPEVITDVIRVAQSHGNAVTSMPYNEQIFIIDEGTQPLPRSIFRVKHSVVFRPLRHIVSTFLTPSIMRRSRKAWELTGLTIRIR